MQRFSGKREEYNSILNTSTPKRLLNRMRYKNRFSNLPSNFGRRTSSTTSGADRFIPNREASNFNRFHFNTQDENENDEKNEYRKMISEALDIQTGRIFSYRPPIHERHENPLREAYTRPTKSDSRYIPSEPEKILDAPNFIDDYYLNVLDWSAFNLVAVALGNEIYLWNVVTGNIEVLREYENGDHACSLAWMKEDENVLAIGSTNGTIELWNIEIKKPFCVMEAHSDRVSSLAWNANVLSSGSRNGLITNNDIRSRNHNVAILNGHTQEVCGLKWSTDFKHLASGGNDNLVNIWSGSSARRNDETQPIYVFDQHCAAVRALAWCPWKRNLLATGGGTADRCIKFWNINNGILTDSIDSQSQVCSLLWSKTYKEIISAHGSPNNQLTIWKYPSMQKQCNLTGHTARVLYMALSPDGNTVMSAAADETIRIWKCFAPDVQQLKRKKSITNMGSTLFGQYIR